MTKERTSPRRVIPGFTLAALAEFLIYYIISLVADDFDVIYYYIYFIERFILLAIPVSAAAILVRRDAGWKGSIITTAYISLTRLIVFIPFFYIEYVYSIYDSVEAIILSLVTSLATVIIYMLLILGAYALMRLIIKKRGGAEFPVRMLELSSPAVLAVFAVSFIIFLVNLGFEIYSTVVFFIENGTVYYIDEIVLMVVSYVFLAVLLLGIHALGCLALNRSGAADEVKNDQ